MPKKTKAPVNAVKVEADLITGHSFEFAKTSYTGLDLANDAVKLQEGADSLADDQDVFGQKFILFARTCGTSAEFLALCGSIEARQSWKSKQNPVGEKTAPTVWKQYKSNIKTAWENFDITPQDVDTVSQLNKALNAARKEKKEQETAETGEATTGAIVEALNTDSKLGAAMGSITQCFDQLSPELQAEMLSELHGVVAYFEDQLDAEEPESGEIAALEAHIASSEQPEQKQAAH